MIWHTCAITIKGTLEGFRQHFSRFALFRFCFSCCVFFFKLSLNQCACHLSRSGRIHKLWDLSFPFHWVDVFTRWIFSIVCFQMSQFTVWSVHRCDNTDMSSFVTAIYWRKIQQHKCSLMRVFGFSSQNTRILLRVSKKHNIIEMENFKVFQHGKHYCKDI